MEKRRAIVTEASRDGYSIGQVINHAMTVEQLRDWLDNFYDDDYIVISHDRGYTYGSIDLDQWREVTEDEDGEFEDYPPEW